MSQKIQIKFSKTQEQQLRRHSEKLGSSIASVVRLAVTDFFDEQ